MQKVEKVVAIVERRLKSQSSETREVVERQEELMVSRSGLTDSQTLTGMGTPGFTGGLSTELDLPAWPLGLILQLLMESFH